MTDKERATAQKQVYMTVSARGIFKAISNKLTVDAQRKDKYAKSVTQVEVIEEAAEYMAEKYNIKLD